MAAWLTPIDAMKILEMESNKLMNFRRNRYQLRVASVCVCLCVRCLFSPLLAWCGGTVDAMLRTAINTV